MSEQAAKTVIEKLEVMLPNRNDIRNYIWDNLQGPLDATLDSWLVEKIENYGSWKVKHRKDGKLAYRGWIFNKRKSGHWEYYYKNGLPRIYCYFRNNSYHNKCTFWEVDGSYEVRHYYKGRLHGELLRYDKKGTLQQKWIYEMGKSKHFKFWPRLNIVSGIMNIQHKIIHFMSRARKN